MQAARKAYRRRHNPQRIKSGECYTTHELAELLEVSRGTIRNWIKTGLPVMKAQRPHLIKGAEAKAYLKAKQNKNKKPSCKPNELSCLSCKQPRSPWENMVDVKALNDTKLILIAVCSMCGGQMRKLQSMKNAPMIAETFDVQQWHHASIIARAHPHLNCHLTKGEKS